MSDASKELKILISEEGAETAAKGIDKVTASQDKLVASAAKVTASTAGAAKATGGLVDEIGKLGARQNAAKDVIEGVSAAAKGSEGALFGAAKAASNLWAIITNATPIGRAVQLFALLVAGVIALSRHFKGAGADAETLARKEEEAATAAAKLAAEAKKVNDMQVTVAVERIDSIQKAFDRAAASARALRQAQDLVENAEMAMALASAQADTQKRLQGVTDPELRKKIEAEGQAGEMEIRSKYSLTAAASQQTKATMELGMGKQEIAAAREQLDAAGMPLLNAQRKLKKARNKIDFPSDQELALEKLAKYRRDGFKTQEEEKEFNALLGQEAAAKAAMESGQETFVDSTEVARGTSYEAGLTQNLEAYKKASAENKLAVEGNEKLTRPAKDRLMAAEARIPVLEMNQRAADLGLNTAGLTAATGLKAAENLRTKATADFSDVEQQRMIKEQLNGRTPFGPPAPSAEAKPRIKFGSALDAMAASQDADQGGGFDIGKAAQQARRAGVPEKEIKAAKAMGADEKQVIELLKELVRAARGGARAG